MVRYVNSFCCSRQPDNFQIPKIGRAFIIAVFIETILLFMLAAALFVVHDPVNPMGSIYGVLGMYCSIICMVFGTDAVVSENKFQFVAYHVMEAASTAFIVIQAVRQDEALGPLWHTVRWAVLAIKCAFQLGYWALAPLVWKAFGFYAYKVVGGSVPLIRMFHRRRAVLSFLALDTSVSLLLFGLTKAYLLPTAVTSVDGSISFDTAMAALATTVVYYAAMRRAVVTERRVQSIAVLVLLCPLQPAFVGYCLWWLWTNAGQLPAAITYPQFAILGSVAIICRCLTAFLVLYMVQYDYGKGLGSIIREVDRQVSVLPCLAPGGCCHCDRHHHHHHHGGHGHQQQQKKGGPQTMSPLSTWMALRSPGSASSTSSGGHPGDREEGEGSYYVSTTPGEDHTVGTIGGGKGVLLLPASGRSTLTASSKVSAASPFPRWGVLLGQYKEEGAGAPASSAKALLHDYMEEGEVDPDYRTPARPGARAGAAPMLPPSTGGASRGPAAAGGGGGGGAYSSVRGGAPALPPSTGARTAQTARSQYTAGTRGLWDDSLGEDSPAS